jgi:hypothetical protein
MKPPRSKDLEKLLGRRADGVSRLPFFPGGGRPVVVRQSPGRGPGDRGAKLNSIPGDCYVIAGERFTSGEFL